ncbi:MAG: hypothetical protein ACK4GH_04975 [Acinetobacter johnsonii]
MAVQEQTPYIEHVANGVTTSFALGFVCDSADNLVVTVNDLPTNVGDWSYIEGNVVFQYPPLSDSTIKIWRNSPLARSTTFKTYDNSLNPNSLNLDLDKIWLVMQELNVKNFISDNKLQEILDSLIAGNVHGLPAEILARIAGDENTKSLVNIETLRAYQAEIELKNEVNSVADIASQNLQTEVERAQLAEQNLQIEINAIGVGNKAYLTYALMDADKANIPAKSKVTVTNDATASNNGDWQWDGATFTKSVYDPLTQAKADATTKANTAETNAKLYTDSITTNILSAAFTESGYISATGALLASSGYKSTGFIKVVPDQNYRIYSQIAGAARHAWYDKNQVFISAFGEDQTTLTEKTYVAPANAAYIRVSAYQAAAWNIAYIKSKTYVIEIIEKIIQQHMPNVDASKIDYSSSNVKATLDTVISKQNSIITNQNNIVGQLDLLSDKESPYFVNTAQFVKAVLTPTNFGVVNVTARVSDTQMTVSDTTAFVYSGSCVVYDPTANSYTSHNVIGINGTTITVMPPLPANPTQVQTMHDSAQGQHLTLFGYKGLADHIVNCVQKYSYKKSENLIFNFNPAKYLRQTSSLGQITTDGVAIAIPVTLLGTAKTGGWAAGTTNLVKTADLVGYFDVGLNRKVALNIGTNAHTQYLSDSYKLQDGIAGNGFEISFNAQNSDGFIEIPLAVRDESYISSADSQTYKTSGKARLQVFNGSIVIHDAVYAAGQVHHIDVDFSTAETIKVRVTCETSTPTSVLLSGIFAYKKSAKTSKSKFFKDGDVVAFLGDSWTQYPIATNIGETGQIRPDGSVSTGSQWLSRRMREKLLEQSKNVTMLNMGFGGQTSRWGKYWVNTIIALEPKPTHCILCFYINDNNGINNVAATAYDFDPNNMFVNKTVANGGISGRVESYEEWESNTKWLCDKLAANGIKPIVIMPSQTASASQAQAIRSGQLDRIVDGF